MTTKVKDYHRISREKYRDFNSNNPPPKIALCPHCNKLKKSKEFYRHICNKNGLSEWCKECRKSNNRLKREEFKKSHNKPCMDCGGSFDWYCMDFDHVRGIKVERVSAIKKSLKIEEIRKCELVCSNCHRIRTFKNRKPISDSAPNRIKENRELIRNAKSTPCMECGGVFPIEVMDFDHRDPSKKLSQIGAMYSYKKDSILEEINKCDVVCSNCHRKRTYLKKQNGAKSK